MNGKRTPNPFCVVKEKITHLFSDALRVKPYVLCQADLRQGIPSPLGIGRRSTWRNFPEKNLQNPWSSLGRGKRRGKRRRPGASLLRQALQREGVFPPCGFEGLNEIGGARKMGLYFYSILFHLLLYVNSILASPFCFH